MNNYLRILHSLTIAMAFSMVIIGATCSISQGQTQPPELVRNKYLVIVKVKPGDTLASLAQTYLGDSRKAWQIADYNQVRQATTGRRLVIPLRPLHRGGLHTDGYQCVPVLFYPYIGAGSKELTPFPVQTFEGQMQYLRDNGYQTIDLDQLARFLSFEAPLVPKAVVITFDTTQDWLYTLVFPILKKMGFKAAVFVTTSLIEKKDCLSWKQLAEMNRAGFDIGTNGVNGRNLKKDFPDSDPTAYLKALEDEIALSQQAIAQHLKKKCLYFAYPDGQTDDYVIALLKKYGFKVAFTRKPGVNSFDVNNFLVNRAIVGGRNDHLPFYEHLTPFIPVVLK